MKKFICLYIPLARNSKVKELLTVYKDLKLETLECDETTGQATWVKSRFSAGHPN